MSSSSTLKFHVPLVNGGWLELIIAVSDRPLTAALLARTQEYLRMAEEDFRAFEAEGQPKLAPATLQGIAPACPADAAESDSTTTAEVERTRG